MRGAPLLSWTSFFGWQHDYHLGSTLGVQPSSWTSYRVCLLPGHGSVEESKRRRQNTSLAQEKGLAPIISHRVKTMISWEEDLGSLSFVCPDNQGQVPGLLKEKFIPLFPQRAGALKQFPQQTPCVSRGPGALCTSSVCP